MTKFWFLAAVVIAMLASVSIAPLHTLGQKGKLIRSQAPVPNSYIVVLNDEIVGKEAVAPVVEAEGQYLTSLYGGNVKTVYSSSVKGFSVEMTDEQAQAMHMDPSVQFVEEDGYISVSSNQLNPQWTLDRVDQRNMPLNGSYGYTNTGAGVHAYILDTGIRATHVEFGGRANSVFDSIGDGQNGFDCNGHGTHVAGIIGSATYGVAKGVLLHGVRVLPCSGNGQISNLLAGVDWVTANHISPSVANISITAAGGSPALETGVNNSIASGVTYAIAAGNGNWDACNFTPARTPNALTVGASDETDLRARYSNFGACVDIFAPGNLVVSTWSSTDTATNNLSGTSMASPMVAGAAALYLETNRTASSSTVSQAIKSSATSGVLTTNDPTSPNLLLYSWISGSPAPTPTPTPTATPTPTPSPTPTPGTARVSVKKRLHNTSGGTSTTVAFPYAAVNLAAASFALVDNTTYQDPNVQAFGSQNPVVVTEATVEGYRLESIDCTETVNGTPTTPTTTLDLATRRASIVAQPGSDIICTFTSEPLVPTAAPATVSGRVVTPEGIGVRGIKIRLFDASTGESFMATTNAFGYYVFTERPVLHFYVLTALGTKKYDIPDPTRSFTLRDDLADVDFVAIRN